MAQFFWLFWRILDLLKLRYGLWEFAEEHHILVFCLFNSFFKSRVLLLKFPDFSFEGLVFHLQDRYFLSHLFFSVLSCSIFLRDHAWVVARTWCCLFVLFVLKNFGHTATDAHHLLLQRGNHFPATGHFAVPQRRWLNVFIE